MQSVLFLFWIILFSLPLIFVGIRIHRAFRLTGRLDLPRRELRWTILLALAGAASYSAFEYGLSVWTDHLWFRDLHYENRFWTELLTKWGLSLAGFATMAVFLLANVWIAAKAGAIRDGKEGTSRRMAIRLGIAAALFVSLVAGAAARNGWEEFLLYLHQAPFGIPDPVFRRDIAFFVFTVPVLGFVRSFLFFSVLLSAAITWPIYFSAYRSAGSTASRWAARVDPAVPDSETIRFRWVTHASSLGVLLVAVLVLHALLSRWNILFSTRGTVFGAGWTDINVDLRLGYPAFFGIIAISAVLFLMSAFSRSHEGTRKNALAGLATLVPGGILVLAAVPGLVQHFYVSPNEQRLETEYIRTNLAYTRTAYGLTDNQVQRFDFPAASGLDPETLAKERAALSGVRLWDYRVLQTTNAQKQAFRLYYDFPDVDVVRYRIGGKLVQMMYSARELDTGRLAPQSRTWQNERLVYTHGFGACANPANTFTPEGLPDYWLKDIPPSASYPELAIKQPRIYFGEKTTGHIYVRTTHPEFDYPEGEKNATFSYDGPGGIELSTALRKLVYALRFDGVRLLIASEITGKSRILYRRDISSRVRTLAPFLRFDKDPYQVIAQGGLWYFWDAYTATDMFPYSEPYRGESFNYLRNSVKVTVNAYTGEVAFYIFDEGDPIIRSYANVFPGMFRPASAMPAELKGHVRYPEGQLRVQADIYALYHMQDPSVFYNKEDAWERAKAIRSIKGQGAEVMDPYYSLVRLPGEKEEEYVLIQLFTPLTTEKGTPRSNMVGWLAGRCDGTNYGKLVLYTFPKNRLVYGPLQIGSRINQDDTISKDFSLWNQQGSTVVQGDMLVIPLSGYRLLYIQPIYLQADVGKMPELRRVVVSTGDQIGYGKTFEEALRQLTGKSAGIAAPTPAEATPTPSAAVRGKSPGPSTEALAREAAGHLERYRQLTAQGKHAEAGKELEELGKTIERLVR
ncbi:MAG: UPF0182 family protein [Deltaproteobacteria bacterium]|nr:UPF0182 family protein [Deltaproteobacteria bacterium]